MDEPLTRERESARQRALRIPLAYHRTRGALGRTKLGLSLLCFMGGGFYLAWVLGGGRPAATQVSPGTLASAHARWESDCRACHVPFTPTRSDSFGSRAAGMLLGTGLGTSASEPKAAHHQADAKCSACHKAAVHQANQIADEVESCASCHREHQGKQALLVRTDDQNCTRCHSSIAAHNTTAGEAPIKDVLSFGLSAEGEAQQHPGFRSLEKESDPGNIRFSHPLHMTPGQLYPGQAPPAGKELVQLRCESCHTPTTTVAGGGAYMQPIKYEQHCRSCHPLHVPGRGDAAIPHGLRAAQLEAPVVGSLVVDERDKSAAALSPQRPIPGKTPRDSLADTLNPPLKLRASQHLQELRTNVCAKCHSWQDSQPAEVMPAAIPAVWLTHAKFSHKAHRAAAKCEECHAQTSEKLPFTGQPGKLADDDRVMIPGIDNCVRCHAPRNETSSTGGARFDCAECHRYHNSPKPPAKEPLLATQLLSSDKQMDSLLLRESQISSLKSQISASHPFVGTQSCSATGCHGAAQGNGLTASYTQFVADDPHPRAFLLLYTQPSLNMVRRLTNQPQAELEDEAYFAFLKQKCVGCHATPPTDAGRTTRPASFSAGVSCESCHGPAASWEFNHFSRTAKKSPDQRNLEDISIRAKACAECHIGPQVAEGQTYDVNHDLIAAGHPRLTFEFEAQLSNLPAHWSAAKDVKPHFEAWRLGELATAAQQDKLQDWRQAQQTKNEVGVPEFASHRCFDCHHGLSSKPAAGRVTFPPLAGITKEQREWLSSPTPSKQEQAGILLKLLGSVTDERTNASSGTRWEEHVRFSLALSAFAVDSPRSGDLIQRADALREILTYSFRSLPSERKLKKDATFAGGPYDSPTGFDPKDEQLWKVLENIRASLTSP